MAAGVSIPQLGQVFRAAGFSPAGAAGVVGNLQQESGLNASSPGGGLAQWQGPRYAALQSYAASQGKPVNDPIVQAQFVVNEIRTQYPGLYSTLRTATDPRAAALAVSQQYERPGIPMNQNRENYAASALGQLGGKGGSAGGGGVGGPAGASVGGASGTSVTVPITSQTFDQQGYNQARAKYIAGTAVKAASGSANPFSGGVAGASKGFANGLGSDSAGLFAKGLLTTGAPNPQNYVGSQTQNLTFATSELQKMAGTPLVNAHGGAQGYVNPIPGAVVGRTDQGVDANLTAGKPILAMGDSKVVQITPWYKGQPLVLMQLTSGPQAGKYWYVAEQIAPSVKAGQTVRAGQQIGTYAPSGTGLELGWGSPSTPHLTLATAPGHGGYQEGQATPEGASFRSFLGSLR